ncbi:pseudouridine synthase [Alkalidesulfovibrio alkalitolerans DSM 16529]|uniref:Pseudouridine synthase n=1 Tax=Alkalidesulfovibrio alkalitolerans DSM 16529 TaxID=1121439 RepID=S7T559_9BACT|nr:pseudouridine synthase [Alkalidesulfovibrio alkalitolerans]EPR31640.1 pseudouridine synthase [Alkalidesulfovibrio alkalitolerans DSM 16529]
MIASVSITNDFDGERLDRALAAFLPDLGLRGRRRMCEKGMVLVDGAPRTPGYRVRAGQEVRLLTDELGSKTAGPLHIVAQDERYATLVKPEGLHSARLAGGGASAEDALRDLFLDQEAILCTRLDQATSGLLLVAFGEGAARAFRDLENAGLARKTYLAVVAPVNGQTPPSRLVFDRALDTADRKRTRVLDVEAEEFRRTVMLRLCPAGEGEWLVGLRILKGARHQIRAHLAHAGLPIVGDALYGDAALGIPLHLHHFRLEFPGFDATTPPPWPLWERLGAQASARLDEPEAFVKD